MYYRAFLKISPSLRNHISRYFNVEVAFLRFIFFILLLGFMQVAQGAVLLGQYRLEDSSWGVVADSSGNARNGLATGSPAPTPATGDAARTGATGTCGYGSFVGGSGGLNVPSLPVNLSAGAKTSVSFWMKWNGIDGVMPIGWQAHDLWLTNSFFGFNTANSDLYGINATGLANGWHHVVAVFTNGNVAANSLYIDGVAQVLSQKMSTPNNALAVVNSTLRISGWGNDANYKFAGLIDEVKVFDGALTLAEVSTLYNETHACPTGLTVQTTSIGGVGTFGFTGTNGLPASVTNITTTASNTPATTAALRNVAFTSYNTATSITQASLPAGYTLTSASCVDDNNALIAGVTLLGNTLTIPASAVVLGANITCTFVNSTPAEAARDKLRFKSEIINI